MTASTPAARQPQPQPAEPRTAGPTGVTTAGRFHIPRPDLYFAIIVLAAYAGMAAVAAANNHAPDSMMLVAERALGGHLDAAGLQGATDTVNVGGHYYLALGPLQLIPYLPFAAVPAFQGVGRFIACLLFGVPAAWLSLPLARAYGAKGSSAFWIATFTAFGSLLFYISVFGDVYYLAQAEAFLALTLFLLEWAGRRRPAALGALLAFSFLARPTTVFAAVPFGLILLWHERARLLEGARVAVRFGLPVAAAIALYGWFNWVRFASPLESGYAISTLREPALEARRALGIFSIAQVPENVRLALLSGFGFVHGLPVPSPWGLSMLLVSPALVIAIWAGLRDRTAQLLWIATALVALPVFLYYGGGYSQYGFRYSLDFTPFLVALMAEGSRRWIGRPEKLLVVASVVSVVYGLMWGLSWHAG
jgi:hypothetical protein